MRGITLFCLILSLQTTSVFGQKTDTVYYDADWEKTWDSNKYEFYRIFNTALIDDVYYVKDYFLSGELQMTGQFLDAKHKEHSGHFIWYYKNGKKEHEANYVKDKLHGNYFEWYENGQMEISKEYNMDVEVNESISWYENGQISDKYIYKKSRDADSAYSWWENGNLKRIGTIVDLYTQFIKIDQYWTKEGEHIIIDGLGEQTWESNDHSFSGKIENGLREGVWIKKDSVGNIKGELKFKEGEFIKGFITDNGYKDKFDTWERDPDFTKGSWKGLAKFVGSNLAYVCDDIIYNTVYIKFVVNGTGDIEQISVLKGDVSDCQFDMIKNMFAKMPNWTPAIQAGAYVRVSFTIPISFKKRNNLYE